MASINKINMILPLCPLKDWEVDQGMGSDTETHGDEPDIDSDIKDLEFRLTTNLSQVQSGSRSFTLKDINVLKVFCFALTYILGINFSQS